VEVLFSDLSTEGRMNKLDTVRSTTWLKDSVVRVMGSFTLSEGMGLSSCIGSRDVIREGTMVSCGGDGACSVMKLCR
jgi:hypothetical protein